MHRVYKKRQIYYNYLKLVILLSIILLLTGCAASRIKTSADKEVYKILDKKTKEVIPEKIPCMAERF